MSYYGTGPLVAVDRLFVAEMVIRYISSTGPVWEMAHLQENIQGLG